MDPKTRLALIAKFGLDKPLLEQFVLYLYNLFSGEFGVSFVQIGRPVVDIILGRKLVNTVILMGSSMFLAFALGIIVGVIAVGSTGRRSTCRP